ncbi:4Fe-4S dicluster domain-containing protein [Paractinoplanes rishiriensis]|uniref:4Fe-4S ferredoxin n=1 Tax=Paractinoplanes rishiriensis TaxID=1050105 RepID=A0A919MW32_9ACTN|nr:4Fe-4S dicluster domain-containing protein [Actinoplanes rishiriensis]GIF02052.1 4Fe-4S ferredoxin [Actinoplanes rishiriensis]
MLTQSVRFGPPVVLGVAALPRLFDELRERGYTVVGPTVRDGAIMLAELESATDLPYGWGVEADAGRYRLRKRTDTAAFAHAAGPQSVKDFLHPPRARLWSSNRDGTGVRGPDEPPRYALIGVRPCDLAAIGVLDRVLNRGEHPEPIYTSRRAGVFVVAVDCTEPAATCFCTSMGGGPGAHEGFDLAMTELLGKGGHRFVIRAGTPAGADVLAALPAVPAAEATLAEAEEAVAGAERAITRAMPSGSLPDLLAASVESPHWADVAARCLTCANCTMVCPTCFCTTTADVTDLTGDHAERWRRWDSCFDLDYSYMHGGSVRRSGASRYRQWITHKLGTWHEQFDSSGCVGCGRCIAWCPAGIDITVEAAALAGSRPGDEQPC